jgi:AraC-like DNA-binding protein
VKSDVRHVPAFMLGGFWDELEKRNVSPLVLASHSGVRRPERGDFHSTVAETDMHRLFEAAVALTGDQTLGLSVGQAMGATSFHLLGHMVLASKNLEEAVALSARAQPALRRRPPALYAVGERSVRLGFFRRRSESLGARVEAEMTGVMLYSVMLHFYARGSWQLPIMQFAHAAPVSERDYRQFFPAGVQFETDGTFALAPRDALVQQRTGADTLLVSRLFGLTRELFGSADTDDAWSGRVRNLLRSHQAPAQLDAAKLARQLGLSPRALARRLAREDTSFKPLIEQVLHERAVDMLRCGSTASEVAQTLGYLELSSFFRAFRRWTGGLTPTEYRRRWER